DARVKFGKVTEALADADEGLRLGPVTPRMLYNAARVHAQAVSRLSEPAAGQRPDRAAAFDCESRAVELLRQALERVPAAERAAFWQGYVRADSAFSAIRHGNAMNSLATEIGRPGS